MQYWTLQVLPAALYNTLAAYPAEGRLLLAPAMLKISNYDKFINVWFIKFASALATGRVAGDRVASALRSWGPPHWRPAASAVAPMPFLNCMTLLNQQYCGVFSEFLHIKGWRFPYFFSVQVYVRPLWTMKSFTEIVRTFFRNPEHRHTDGQTDAVYWKLHKMSLGWRKESSDNRLTQAGLSEKKDP